MLDEIKSALAERDEAIATELKAVKTENAELSNRLEEIEAKASMPGKMAATRESDEHCRLFLKWFSRPHDATARQELENIQTHLSRKDMLIGTPSQGGYAVPEELAREIERHEKKFSPVRDLVQVRQIGSSDFKMLLNERGATAAWSSETGTRSAQSTPTLREVVPTQGELYSVLTATQWLIDDAFFNLRSWLVEEAAQQFAQAEGIAVISSSGSNQPTGMLNSAPTSRDDFDSPIRAAAVYQYVSADDDSPFAISYDGLVNLIMKTNSAYRGAGTFVMNSTTLGIVAKLKDSENRPLWVPSVAEGVPGRLLGYPVVAWEDMPDIDVTGGSDATFPIAFGDFRRGYLLVDRVGLRIVVDNVTTLGSVRYYINKRVGGIVLNNDAIKFLRTAA